MPALRERIVEHRMNYPTGPAEPAFPTRKGTAQRPDNVRSRILAPVRVRANELLAEDGRLPIAHMTPHTLRRTFASILAATNVPPRRAMYLLGHTDATLTLSVYQQVLDAGAASIEVLERVLGCSLQAACDVLTGRVLVPPRRTERVASSTHRVDYRLCLKGAARPAECRGKLHLIRLSSQRPRQAVRQDCSFAKKQASPLAPGRRPLREPARGGRGQPASLDSGEWRCPGNHRRAAGDL